MPAAPKSQISSSTRFPCTWRFRTPIRPTKNSTEYPIELTEKEKIGRYFTTFWGVLRRNRFGRGQDAIEVTKLEDNYGYQTKLDRFVRLK